MAQVVVESSDTKNSYIDLSGVDSSTFANPYDALIEACNDDPAILQEKYSTHRRTRNAQQKANFLSPSFSGLILDPILLRLVDPSISPGFVDPRNCIVFWGRPPPHIRSLATTIQAKLKEIAPRIWLMPSEKMHITALEITHSQSPPAIPPLIAALSPAIAAILKAPTTNPSRLIKPLLSFDAAAVALSFVPATSQKFSYHHLRRDLFAMARGTGIEITSRYVVPSAHMTLCRFLYAEDHDNEEKREAWVRALEEINEWLVETYWKDEGAFEWIVDQELLLRKGKLWYGDGETVAGEGVTWKGIEGADT